MIGPTPTYQSVYGWRGSCIGGSTTSIALRLVVPDQYRRTGKVRKVRHNVLNPGDLSAGDQLQACPWSNRTRGFQPVAFSQKGRRPGNHTKGGRLQSHGAGQHVAQQGRSQGLSTKFAHEAGIHRSQEHAANYVEVLTCPLSAREVKASVFDPRGFFPYIYIEYYR